VTEVEADERRDQDNDLVTLFLSMPPERAEALLTSIHDHKADGNIGAVWINARHIIAGTTSGRLPRPAKVSGVVTGAIDQRTWWGWNALFLAFVAVAALCFSVADQPTRTIAVFFGMAYPYVRHMSWRWSRRRFTSHDRHE